MGDFGQQWRPSRNGNSPKPIAIVGMACRLPAGFKDIENFWTALASGQSGWTPHPKERLLPETYYHPNPDKKGTYDQKGAHYVQEDIGRFDAAFFNVKAAEATYMDPQQRHLLEMTYEALENAGIPMSLIAGTQTGVFVGGNPSEYRSYLSSDSHNLSMYETTGNAESLLANRVSYVFDLRGPSMSIDTACSSSLVALNVAVQSLQAGESTAAIVGGSHLTVMPESTVSLSTTRLLSPDGKSYAFDERATSGFGRGEGTSCIVLKPLDAALRDGDPVRAIIRNSGCNQDGKTAGITMPNGEAQKGLIRSVYEAARLDPLETAYVEAHGTGTATGDPIEASALGEIFGRRSDQAPLTIGSLKSNIGHLEGTSGISSVIKTALMLERKFLLPNCDLQKLNPKIPFDKWNMKVCRKYKPWDSKTVRRASVNNFGFGGTNAHVIMEEAIDRPDGVLSEYIPSFGIMNNTSAKEVFATEELMHLMFLFSANDRDSLQRQISLIVSYIGERPINLYPHLLKSLAYTLGQRRSSHAWRIAIPASTQNGLLQGLKDVALAPIKATEQPRIGFLFTGQGAQWPKMGMSLYHTYVAYARSLDKASKTLSKLGASWSLVDEIEKDESCSGISKPHISQPACTAVQMALVDLFSSWGMKPASVCGHSSGEIAAAYAAGTLEFESCIAIAYYRGVVSMELTENMGKGAGGMLAVGASQQETQDLIDAIADVGVRVACVNSPRSTTISGDTEGIRLVQELADKKSIWNRRLHVDVAYHSHHMDVVSGRYRDLLGELSPSAHVGVDFFSSLKGCKVDPTSLTSAYWVENLTSPVLFSPAVSELCGATSQDNRGGVDTLVEIGPHSALQGPVRQILQAYGSKYDTVRSLPSLKRDEHGPTSILRLASLLWMSGYPLDIGQINFPDSSSASVSVLTDLPPYQWNHSKRYWHDGRLHLERRSYSTPRHDLLGSRVLDCSSFEPQWTNTLVADDVPWLRDHKVEDVVIFPAAGYVSMAIEACRQQARWRDINYDRIVFREISIARAMAIPDSGSVEVRLSLVPLSESAKTVSDTWYQFTVLSWASERGWTEHCRGLVAAVLPSRANDIDSKSRDKVGLDRDVDDMKRQAENLVESIAAKTAYDDALASGFEFGPMFQGTKQVMMSPSTAKYVSTIPDTAACMPHNYESEYILHPIGLDLLFQAPIYFLTSFGSKMSVAYMPVSIEEITILTGASWKAKSQMQVYARCRGGDLFSGSRTFDYAAVDLNGASADRGVVVKGMVEVPMQSARNVMEDGSSRCLRVQWEPCMSYLTPVQFTKVLAPYSTKPSGRDEFQMLEDLSYHYITQALQQTNPESVTAPHLVRLYDWMKKQVQMLHDRDGSLFYDGDSGSHVLRESAKAINSTMSLVRDIGEKLGAILQGRIEPQSLFPPGDQLGHFGGLDGYERLFTLAAKYVEKLRHQNPRLRVLVIGEGTAVAAGASILQSTGGNSRGDDQQAQFEFGNKNPDFSAGVKAKLAPIAHLVNHKIFDIEGLPAAQGFEVGSYDLVITCDLFDTALERCPLANIRSLLKLGGQLLSLETSNVRNQLSSFPFATLPTSDVAAEDGKEELHMNGHADGHMNGHINGNMNGHMNGNVNGNMNGHMNGNVNGNVNGNMNGHMNGNVNGNVNGKVNGHVNGHMNGHVDNFMDGHVNGYINGSVKGNIESESQADSCQEQWDERLQQNHFSGIDGTVQDYPKHPEKAASIVLSTAIDQSVVSNDLVPEIAIVSQWLPHGMSRSDIEAALIASGPSIVTWIDFSKLAKADLVGKYCIIIDNPNNPYLTRMTPDSFDGLKCLLQTAGVLWITGGVSTPNAGLVKGLARTIRAEMQTKTFVTLAIDKWGASDSNTLDTIRDIFTRSFYPLSPDIKHVVETELAVEDGIVRIPRMVQDVEMDQSLMRETHPDSRYLQPFEQKGRPLKMTISNPGFLDTLCFIDDEQATKELQDHEIEIDIKAAGLNFKDVILALGQLAGNHLGQECSGVVTKIGRGVTGLQPGDRVCAVAPNSIATLGRCPAHCAVPIPDSMSYAEGASIPLIYCTAYYCLVRLANLQRGETVLIHAAAGGVGQAAIMVAQAVGAKIFATVGHIDKKRWLMETYGIPEDCIFYSRDTSFAQGVLDATNGVGVDAALSSLAGEQLRATWRCMAPFGRFVEIGKRDIMSNTNLQMAPFERSVSFMAFDLADLIQTRPAQMLQIFSELMDWIRQDRIRPVAPIHEYSFSQAETAFRSLQSGKPMGKVVLVPKADDAVMTTRPTHEPVILQADASYLITGGTGGIGRAVCEWMAEHGAKNIILASRSGKTQSDTMELVQRLSVNDVRVEVCQCDVANMAEVRLAIKECEKSLPPIRGIIHGAYVNKDVLFENATFSDWNSVVQPKFSGAWNLHNAFLSQPQPLDFFVMLSSVSGVVGNRGQAAYAAANSFLDDFAHYRKSLGLSGTSVDLGVVHEIGHIAERADLQAKVSHDAALSKADVLALVKLAIQGEIDRHADHQCVTGLSFEHYDPRHPAFFWATDARFTHLRRSDDSNFTKATVMRVSTKQALQKADTRDDAVRVATDALVEKFSSVLIVPVEEMSREKTVVSLGLDSLIAVEVRSWIKREMDAAMSTMELLTSSSIVGLAETVVEKSGLCERFVKEEAAGKDE